MARKSLIIGLGTTGFEVIDQLIERINWEYGGTEHTPWVQFLGLETKSVAATFVDENDDALRLTLTQEQQQRFRNQPETLRDRLNHEKWMDLKTRERITGPITDGAGEIRMRGRLLFMHPTNLDKIKAQIESRLLKLDRLNNDSAKARRGPLPDGTNPSISLDDTIWVYVVGTLSGGTCSGSCIDLGYLLRREFASSNISTAGIFMLPHYSHRDPEHRSNALSALQEINHYSSPGVEYIEYPGYSEDDGKPIVGQRPYDYSYIIQTPKADPLSFIDAKTAVANYLRTDVFLPQIGDRDGEREQLAGQAVGEDRQGAPRSFYTFGLSAIEFPAALIVQGCCHKLCAAAIKDWLQHRHLTDQDIVNERVRLEVDETLIGQALRRCDGDSIDDRIKRIVDDAVRNYAGNRTLTTAEKQIEHGFEAQPGGVEHRDMPTAFIKDTVEKNFSPVNRDYQKRVLNHLIERLGHIDAGPDYCCQFLDHLIDWLSQRRKTLTNRKSDASNAQTKMNEARGWLEQCKNDGPLGLLAGRGLAIKRYKAEYTKAAKKYFAAKVLDCVQQHEGRICDELEEQAKMWRRRIGGEGQRDPHAPPTPNSLERYAADLVSAFEKGLEKVDREAPRVNGYVFFTPKETIGQHYRETLNITPHATDDALSPEEAAARASVIDGWHELGEQLAQPKNESLFDFNENKEEERNRDNQRQKNKNALLLKARDSFLDIFRKSVLEMVANRGNEFMQEQVNKSDIMLEMALDDASRYRPASKHRYGLAFFEGADKALEDENLNTPSGRIGQMVSYLREHYYSWLDSYSIQDRHNIIFLQERGAFSLMLIEGVRPGQGSFQGALAALEAERVVHSRADIDDWIPLEGEKDLSEEWHPLFLLGITLSRNGNADRRLIRWGNRPGGGSAWIYEPQPRLATLSAVVFENNLRDISSKLSKMARGQVGIRLRSEIGQIRERETPEAMAAAIEEVMGGVAAYRIKYGSSELAKEQAWQILLKYFKDDERVMEQIRLKFPVDDFLIDQYQREQDATHPQTGYYCPDCDGLLSPERDEVMPSCQHCGYEIYRNQFDIAN